MSARLCWNYRLLALALIGGSWTGGSASAQTLDPKSVTAPMGVSAAEGARRLAVADARRIQGQQRDSLLNGVLIGAAIGAAPGIYWLIADPNECRGLCPEEYGFIAAGAVIGGLIDRAVHKNITVYTPAPTSRVKSVGIGPLFTRHRKGVQVAMTF